MTAEFDVGLVTLDRRLKTHNVPGKTLSYLYWGKPVLASINPGNDLFDLLRESQAGLCLVNGQDEALAAAADRLANDPSLRAAMTMNRPRSRANSHRRASWQRRVR
jgi:glycosyltransferase involved in cell wall biosynthesis